MNRDDAAPKSGTPRRLPTCPSYVVFDERLSRVRSSIRLLWPVRPRDQFPLPFVTDAKSSPGLFSLLAAVLYVRDRRARNKQEEKQVRQLVQTALQQLRDQVSPSLALRRWPVALIT